MKVMYVAANRNGADDLMIETEITELQSQFLSARGEFVAFFVFPQLNVEDLALKLREHKPDVLHITAHGDAEHLALTNADAARVELDGRRLRSLFDPSYPPRLVYINACDSHQIAAAIVAAERALPGVAVPMAIGTTAPITNRAARAAAATFYQGLLSGNSVATAYDGCRAVIETIQADAVSAVLRHGQVKPHNEILYQPPRIVARFAGNGHKGHSGFYDLEFGVIGCPSDTTQIVFFTDDESFLHSEEYDNDEVEYGPEIAMAGFMCRVVRSSPVNGVLWSESEQRVYGDYRVVAAGVTSSGRVFSLASMACEAVECGLDNRESRGGRAKSAGERRTLARLRQFGGTEPDGQLAGNSKVRGKPDRRARRRKQAQSK